MRVPGCKLLPYLFRHTGGVRASGIAIASGLVEVSVSGAWPLLWDVLSEVQLTHKHYSGSLSIKSILARSSLDEVRVWLNP